MRIEVLLVLVVVLVAVFIVRLRTRLALLAEQIRQLRAHELEPVTYSPAPDDTLDGPLAKVTAEAEALGFRVLGDYIENSTLERGTRAARWIVDAAHTTFGWLAPFEVGGQRHVIVVLMSHELDLATITSRQPPSSMLSRPPFIDFLHVAPTTSITETLARHRKRAQLDDTERAFVPVHSFAEVEAELARMRSKVATWRRAQPADELLEADLKALLGAQYARLGGPLRRRLSPTDPA